jgi:hypothetical protein
MSGLQRCRDAPLAFGHRGDLWVGLINGAAELPARCNTLCSAISLGTNSEPAGITGDASNDGWRAYIR